MTCVADIVHQTLSGGYSIQSGAAYSSRNAATRPEVGDHKLKFSSLPAGQTISVLAQQVKNGRLSPYKAGGLIFIHQCAAFSAQLVSPLCTCNLSTGSLSQQLNLSPVLCTCDSM